MTEDSLLKEEEFRSFLKTLGAHIKVIRTAKGMQFRDIMIKMGYYDSQWRKYEAGGSLNISSLMKIAITLDVTLTELLDGLGQWPRLSVAEIQAAPDREADGALESEPASKPKRIRSSPATAKETVTRTSKGRPEKKLGTGQGPASGRTSSRVSASSADSEPRPI